MKKTGLKTSKFLSYVLRHHPEAIGLGLDERGWAKVDELLAKAAAHGKDIDLAVLKEVVDTNDKNRFSFSEDFKKIRANQGHSLKIDLGLMPQDPPQVLYHGTAQRFLASIRERGLVPGQRNHVHLCFDRQTAEKVGSRHGKPVVLDIQSGLMHKNGYHFFLSANNVWLTDRVPPEFIGKIGEAA